MNPRERTIAFAVLAGVLLAAGAFLFHQLYLVPLHERQETVLREADALKNQRQRIKKVKDQESQLAEWRKLSLPSAVDLCLREYDERLRAMGTSSGFAVADFKVRGDEASILRTAYQPIKKEAFYIPLGFTVTGRGDLSCVVKLLEQFYRTPLLHKIKNLTIKRPPSQASSFSAAKTREVEIELKVEAIIVNDAENRSQLLPAEKVELNNLAVPQRDYLAIAAKNIFYGTPPPPQKLPDGPDPAKSIHLTSITRGKQGWQALLYNSDDAMTMRLCPEEGFVLFLVKNKNNQLRVMGEVICIDEQDIVFRAGEKHYRIHVGDTLEEAMRRPLTDAQVRALDATRGAGERLDGTPSPIVEGRARVFPGLKQISTP